MSGMQAAQTDLLKTHRLTMSDGQADKMNVTETQQVWQASMCTELRRTKTDNVGQEGRSKDQ